MHSEGKALLRALKRSAGVKPHLCLRVGEPPIAYLRPVATGGEDLNEEDVNYLTRWRNQFVHSFLTEFNSTNERTRQWLVNLVGPSDDRILFMVDDASGRTFAYMGLAFIDWVEGTVEADAIVRGRACPKGTMTLALRSLIDWARKSLGVGKISVRVRSDNTALEFYKKFGFVETERVTLRQTVEPGMISWTEDRSLSNSPVTLVHMTLQRPTELSL
jgi:RimJ/RimL family protein N-acetyltransferase